jgi:phage shock protein C
MSAATFASRLGAMNEDTTATGSATTTSPIRKLYRSRDDRTVAAILRIALVAATVLGVGTGALLYLICWIIIPEEA